MANFVVGFLTGGAADTALSSGERPLRLVEDAKTVANGVSAVVMDASASVSEASGAKWSEATNFPELPTAPDMLSEMDPRKLTDFQQARLSEIVLQSVCMPLVVRLWTFGSYCVNIGTHYRSFGPFWGWSGVAFAAVVASRRSVDEVKASVENPRASARDALLGLCLYGLLGGSWRSALPTAPSSKGEYAVDVAPYFKDKHSQRHRSRMVNTLGKIVGCHWSGSKTGPFELVKMPPPRWSLRQEGELLIASAARAASAGSVRPRGFLPFATVPLLLPLALRRCDASGLILALIR